MKKNAILIMLLIAFNLVYAQQYHHVHPYPQSQSLSSVCFLDSLIGYAVGGEGIIIKTTDAGESWTYQESSISTNLTSLSYFDYNHGLITAASGKVQITTDGGDQWISKQTGVTIRLNAGFCISLTEYIAVGNNGTIIKSTDGGNSWIQLNSGITVDLYSVYFTSGSKGIAVGRMGKILQTIDGGLTWSQVSSSITNDLNSVFFLDENTGYIAGGPIYKTTDGGNSWMHWWTGGGYNSSIVFKDSLHGAAAGGHTISLTTNGGLYWVETEVEMLDAYNSIRAVGYNGSLVFAVGTKGAMFFSRDEGQNWEGNIVTLQDLHSIFVIDKVNVIAVGKKGTILKSTNGGDKWFKALSGSSASLNDVYFSDANNGMIIGNFYHDTTNFLITTDGGESWINRQFGSNISLNRLSFADENNGVIVGNSGFVMFTSDGGVNWIQKNSGTANNLTGVNFTALNNCYISGYNGIILRTTDMGDHWTTIYSPSYGAPFSDVHFINDQKGFFFGWGISRTLNGGLTWKDVWGAGTDAQFLSDNVGICVGGSRLLKTTNGGADWNQLETRVPSLTQLNKIHLLDYSPGFICGTSGVILRDTSAMLTEINEPMNVVLPGGYDLQQNYPNPFNPSTLISYSLQKYSSVVIKVFDILGNGITTIVNEEKPAGTYEVKWNAAGLPSGVYFYQLRAGGYVETKKMLLTR